MPRRRRGARAMAIEADTERGWPMRILLHSPKDVVAGALAFAAVSAIVANALFLQAGQHPSPMFGVTTIIPPASLPTVSPLPRPRPPELTLKPADIQATEPKSVETKGADPLANLVKATSATPAVTNSVPRPPASIPAPARGDAASNSAQNVRRVAAVQRALTEYGFGQLKPTGTVGSDTQAAIQKFERTRKIPVTGQMSDRLVHELVAMIGHPID
jgi:Putative peptidoglycan binding domain